MRCGFINVYLIRLLYFQSVAVTSSHSISYPLVIILHCLQSLLDEQNGTAVSQDIYSILLPVVPLPFDCSGGQGRSFLCAPLSNNCGSHWTFLTHPRVGRRSSNTSIVTQSLETQDLRPYHHYFTLHSEVHLNILANKCCLTSIQCLIAIAKMRIPARLRPD